MTFGTLARVAPPAYLRGMTAARLLRLLLLLSMLLMPLRMTGVGPAMAADGDRAAMHHEAGPGGHCADNDATPARDEPARVDCMIACAVLPAVSQVFEAAPMAAAIATPLPVTFAVGIAPGFDPPPPRNS